MATSLSLPTAPITITALLLLGLGYVFYRLALPKPLPGNIPYNKKAVTNLLGDVPELFEYRAKYGDIFGLLPQRLRELNSPIMQLFIRPFGRPWVVISDPAEAYDISTRRLKEFDRSYYLGELLCGLLPGHHISLMTGPEWSAHRRLVNDTMSSHFLHNVIAKLFFSETQELIELWRQKTRLAQGHAFSALHDIYAAALEITWTATFGSKTDAITAQVELLKKINKLDLPASKEAAADYPHAPNSPAFDAIANLANSLEIPLAMPFQPSFIHSLALRFFPSLSSSVKLKDQMIRNSLNVASERLASQTDINTTSHLTCVVDIAVQRETQMAKKEGRTPVHDSRVIQDELFGLLVASYETTSTTLCWGLKFLTKHQAVQTRLRAELHAAFAPAVAAGLGAQPDIATIPTSDLPYLDAVIHEIHRCGMTSVALSRRATQDTYVLGHFVPKDTEVFFLNNGPGMVQPGFATDDSGRSPLPRETKESMKGWTGEDAADFDPRRWLKKDASGRDVFDPLAGPMNAFGAGPRGCFGRKWAQLELRFVLVLLLWNFELLPTPDALSGFAAVDKITHQPQKCYVRLKELVQST
ncbi:cytochrome P450 [Xylariaceae sp. AK1471]|nr:cytochrome P450 [Xylariaceae sp. AK1471]